MTPNVMIGIGASFFQSVMVAVLLFFSVRLVRDNGRKITAVFLAFFLALWLLSDLYWLVYDFMRPETRMPFAANEIGEAALFLMLAAIINNACPGRSGRSILLFIGSGLFTLGNVALWIGWSGEWIQDIVSGAIFGWVLYSIARVLRKERALTVFEWILMSVLCALSVVSQALTFFVSDALHDLFEVVGYILVWAALIYHFFKMIASYRRGDNAKAFFALSFSVNLLAFIGMYMSDGNWYLSFILFQTIMLPFCYLSVRKVVEEQ